MMEDKRMWCMPRQYAMRIKHKGANNNIWGINSMLQVMENSGLRKPTINNPCVICDRSCIRNAFEKAEKLREV